MAPENDRDLGTAWIVRWRGAWVHHFNTASEQLMDYDYPVIIAYNGIHHYTSTKVYSSTSKNHAIINLLALIAKNMKDVSSNLEGHDRIKQHMDQTLNQIQHLKSNPSAEFTFSGAPAGVSSGGGPLSQPPAPADKLKYSCDQCDQKFQRSNELQNHLVSKHGEGFICDLCSHEPFASQAALNVHQTLKHNKTSSKNYSCPTCAYTSNRADAVKAHRVKEHGLQIPDDELIKCPNAPLCQKTFITQE